MACTRQPPAGTNMSAACEECGHTVMLHPGLHNPSLEACLVCEMAAIKEGQ